jgi:hypothetical protein
MLKQLCVNFVKSPRNLLIVVQVFSWTSPPFEFYLGPIPMNIVVETPVFISLDVSLTSTDTVYFSSSVYAAVTMKAGFRYRKDASPEFQEIFENSIGYGGSGLSVTSLCGATASLKLGIIPVAQFLLSYVGGPVS